MVVPEICGITLEKVKSAARTYDDMGYNCSYKKVYNPPDFRKKLASDPDEDSVHKLIKFVNSWSNRTRYSTRPHLHKVLCKNAGRNSALRKVSLEDPYLDEGSLKKIQCVFDELCKVKYFGPTGASKFLGIIQPQLCVMWDEPIRKWLGYGGKRPRYSVFLKDMRKLALDVRADAKSRGVDDPAGCISRKLGLDPPFTLATFINHYVWVNITLPLQKKTPSKGKKSC